ncbi:MAG TPA: NUDIX domain-containing protein [Cyclobacteriaceae bacterium]|jgi:ADP-ribose pyrophosphatase YjhB (NUDIX family)|nr:NUDIX domain-containing protein [Cyclobacteriaceae bacterium]
MKMDSLPDTIEEFLAQGELSYLPHLSVDCVVFGFHEGHLKVLLLQWNDTNEWCLPGGFIEHTEPLDSAAVRTVYQRTGLKNIYLRQFHAFGNPSRQRGKDDTKILKGAKPDSWIMKRFITIGYWALVEYSKAVPIPDQFSSQCCWVNVTKVPSLILDHNLILEKALQSLRLSLNDYPVGKDLLSEKFTMPELQRLYETILNRKLDRRNFQKQILSMGILERLKEKKKGGAHRSPFLYRFDKRKYLLALKQGLRTSFA